MRDLGFDCSQEVGLAKIGYGMQDNDKKDNGMWDFHKKGAGMRDHDPPPPLTSDPVL